MSDQSTAETQASESAPPEAPVATSAPVQPGLSAEDLAFLTQWIRVLRTPVDVEVVAYDEHGNDLPLPTYAHEDDAGMDLYAAFLQPELKLDPGEMMPIPTRHRLNIPHGFVMDIRPKSGKARYRRLDVSNSPGAIDSPFDGHVEVLLENRGREPVTIRRGEAIAQMVLLPRQAFRLKPVTQFSRPPTSRGSGGFGSTGR